VDDYLNQADKQLCLLVQAETVLAMENLDAIAAVDGVDGVFFGPADLSASMGLRGQSTHPKVRQAIVEGIARVRKAGKAAGVLTTDLAVAREYLAAGASFVGIGVDCTLLIKGATSLLQGFRDGLASP
jgi:4-hydroxy-2-oxoheptanedioate aldolase